METTDTLAVAVEGARGAGELIMARFGGLSTGEIDLKQAADFVTAVDRGAEEVIVRAIQDRFPDHGFLAEEGTQAGGNAEYRWIIDPLDGTTNYIHQFPVFSVSIALQYRDDIVVGVVFDPVRDELFTARVGRGARLNGKPIAVSGTPPGGRGLVATGFPFRNKDAIDPYLEAFREVFLLTGDLRRAGSAAMDLAYVAAGRVDGFFELGLAPWDIAAGSLLIREAGGVVTDFGGGGESIATGNIVAGNPSMHRELLRTVRRSFRGSRER